MFKSKRFIAVTVSAVLFIIGVFFYHQQPIEFATGIGIILAPYLAAQSYRGSMKNYIDNLNSKQDAGK